MVPAAALAPVLSLRGERRLVIGSEIGHGTRAVVHVARSEQVVGVSDGGQEEIMARTVALKVFDPVICRDPDTLHELRRSVRRMALVRHVNVVAVQDFFLASLGAEVGASEPVPCILEELVDGMSLSRFLARFDAARRRMPLDLALFIGCEIAEALSGARSATSVEGVILNMAHHNLSSRQVLLSWNGEVKVGDFGVRPAGGVISGVRRSDRNDRELLHLAPEVARGGRGDGRSDVFSLGVILHEMLYGPRFRRPMNARQTLELVRDGVVERPVTAPLLPGGIGAIVDRALSPDPRERQAHAGIVAYDLRREALALGVADGRMFLRSAMFEMSEGVD